MIERIAEARKYCRGFSCAFDIGANVGLYAIEMSKHFGQVFAFEPTTRNFNELIANIWQVHNVYAYKLGMSDKSRKEWFDVSGKPQGFHIAKEPGELPSVELCNLVTLDGFFQRFGHGDAPAPDFIKIDVEGHEYEVLLGGEKTIKLYRPVIMIEEKFDPDLKASKLLIQWGFVEVWRKKRDRLFKCKYL